MPDTTASKASAPGSIDGASGRFLLRLDPGLHAALRSAAAAEGVSLNEYCARKLAAPGAAASGLGAQVVRHAALALGADLRGVVVFGSWARGTSGTASDVDALILVATTRRLGRALYRAWDEHDPSWQGRPVEPHFVHLPAADAPVHGLWAEVSLDGLVAFERDFEVSRHLGHVRRRIAAGEIVRRQAHGQPYWVTAP